MLNKVQQDAKTAEESNYWFREAFEARETIENQARRIRELLSLIDGMEQTAAEMRARIDKDDERFKAISEFYNAARKTGYVSEYSLGMVTLETLQEETRAAKNTTQPRRYLVSDLIEVGGMFSESRGEHEKGDGFFGSAPMCVLYKPVYTLPDTVPQKRMTKKTR